MNGFFQRPLGLALAGGGSLGSWQTGALVELTHRLGLRFDAVLGFSAGALNATGYFLDRLDECVARWRSAEQDRLLRLAPRFSPFTLCSGGPVWDVIGPARDEERARREGRCRLVIVSKRHPERTPVYAVFDPAEGGRWDGPLANHLVGSCAIPRIFPPVPAEYQGRSVRLIDGGVPGREPLHFGELAHCKDVIVVEMVRPEEVGRSRWLWNRRFDQAGRESCRRLMDQGIASLQAMPGGRRVFRLFPSKTLEFSMLSFKKPDMEASLAHGARDAMAFHADPFAAHVA